MKTILSLDISTSCTGWALWKLTGELVDAGAIETPTDVFLDINKKMDFAIEQIVGKIAENKAEVVTLVAEAAMKKFSGGKTTANTMAMLIGFNFCLCYSLSRKLLCEIAHIDVKSARRTCGIVIPKTTKKQIEVKKVVILHVKQKYPHLKWELKRTGNFKDWCGDMADALVIGMAHKNNVKN